MFVFLCVFVLVFISVCVFVSGCLFDLFVIMCVVV